MKQNVQRTTDGLKSLVSISERMNKYIKGFTKPAHTILYDPSYIPLNGNCINGFIVWEVVYIKKNLILVLWGSNLTVY